MMAINVIINCYRNEFAACKKNWVVFCKSHNMTVIDAINFYRGKPVAENGHLKRVRNVPFALFMANLLSIAPQIRASKDFEDLLVILGTVKVKYIGVLTLYDTALLLSHCSDKKHKAGPKYIYSHAGAEDGLLAICSPVIKKKCKGKSNGGDKYEIIDLPSPFMASKLSEAQLESLFCTCLECWKKGKTMVAPKGACKNAASCMCKLTPPCCFRKLH